MGPYGATNIKGYYPTAQGYRPVKPPTQPRSVIGRTAGTPWDTMLKNLGQQWQQAGPSVMASITDWANNYNRLQQQQQGGMGGGGNPYAGLIGGDYGVQEMESQMGAGMERARGNFQSQLRQALIDLGITDKSKLGNLGQYIDDTTITNAAANKYSQTAQIEQAQQSAQSQLEASLAARGLLSSGQLTQSTEQNVAQAESQRYSALRDFLSGGAQGLNSLADLQDQYANQLAQARFEAANRAADTYGMYPGYDQYGYDQTGAAPPQYQAPTQGYRGETALGRGAYLQRNPSGNYANYLAAWRRHAAQGGY